MADKLNKTEINQLTESMKQIMNTDENSKDLITKLGAILNLPDDQFDLLAPGIMQAFQQSINNPNDALALVQAMNAAGATAEDLTDELSVIMQAIDELKLSVTKRDFLKDFFGSLVATVNATEGIAKRNVPIGIELCHPDAKIPQYAHISDSGADIYALEDITIHPGETVLIPTGLKVAIQAGYELQIRPKSGRALKTKLRICNTPGTIDQGYRDEVKIIIENVEPPIKDITIDADGKVTSIEYGKDYVIGKGEKFCQMVLAEVPKAVFYRVDNVLNIAEGENRNGGFGSSGLN